MDISLKGFWTDHKYFQETWRKNLKAFYVFTLERRKGGRKRGRETLIGFLFYAPYLGTEPPKQACGMARK